MQSASRVASAAVAVLVLLGAAACGAAENIASNSNRPTTSDLPTTIDQPTTATPAPTSTSRAPETPQPTGVPRKASPGATPPPLDSSPVVPSAAELRAGRSQPVEDPYYPDTSNPEIDALHYYLALTWDGSHLTGEATVTFRPVQATSSVRLDLGDALAVSAVDLDGKPVQYQQAGDGLEMLTGALDARSTHALTIEYAGQPAPTPAPSARPDMADGLGWSLDTDGSVYTFQEPYGAFTWYPVNDHPSDEALYDAAISTAGDDVAVFNGQLVSIQSTDSGTVSRWHLDEPAASYLTTIAIGPYTEHQTTTPSGMRISYWLLPRDLGLLEELEEQGSAAFDWLEQHAGPYPFSTLGVVIVGGGSAMETQTMITMSRGVLRVPQAVLMHEMAHQWYGDSVTPIDWQGLWLSEGWAMYMQQWYEQDAELPIALGGIESWRRYDNAARSRSGPPGDYDPRHFADLNVYLGPAMMLDQIREQVGDATFEQLVKAWPAQHENANVDRETFEAWLNRQTGHRFGPLLHRWLDSADTPR